MKCEKCQILGNPLKKHEMPLISIKSSLTFEIQAIEFVGPFLKLGHKTRDRYIIIEVEYVTKWEGVQLVEYCTKVVATKFIYENIITRFGCPITPISDRGTHFINHTIELLLKEFMIDLHKISAYHLNSIGSMESFNKTLTKGLINICNKDKNDQDDKIPTILWDYRTKYFVNQIAQDHKNFRISTPCLKKERESNK